MTSPRACSVTPIWTVGTRIWLCQGDHIIRYDTRTGIAQRLVSRLRGDITAIGETDGTNLFIGTVNGLFPVRERDGVLEALADTDSIRTPVSELYYHPGSKKLFVGTFRKGILVYGVVRRQYAAECGRQPDHPSQ